MDTTNNNNSVHCIAVLAFVITSSTTQLGHLSSFSIRLTIVGESSEHYTIISIQIEFFQSLTVLHIVYSVRQIGDNDPLTLQ